MKVVDFLYFNFYAFYYKDGNCKSTDNPSLRAANVLSITFLLWIALFFWFYNLFFLGINKFVGRWEWVLVYALLFMPLYYIYCIKNRYQYVYDKFNVLNQSTKKAWRVLSIIFAFIPAILILILGFILNKSY